MEVEPTAIAPPRVEFLLCGSPCDAFYAQIAFFRLSLDQLGPQGRAARVVAVFGSEECSPLPSRWLRHFERIEVHRAPPDEFRRAKYFAASDLRYRLVTPGSACSVLCDADTMLVRPLPQDFLDDLHREPAICGVIAHFPFPIDVDTRRPGSTIGLYPAMPQEQAWEHLGQAILGRPLERPLHYTLTGTGGDDRCPFYINYGFLAGSADLLRRLADELDQLQPELDEILGGYFVGQVGIALAVDRAHIPWRALPMRFNFPNDRLADVRYPEELNQVVMFHYLRDTHFDRHRIFADRRAFEAFLALELTGSDRLFRDRVREVTGGQYPFVSADSN
jgi:hypothetical protein